MSGYAVIEYKPWKLDQDEFSAVTATYLKEGEAEKLLTLDVFGRHLTRANRIYLIEDAVPNIKRFYDRQLKGELENLIKLNY